MSSINFGNAYLLLIAIPLIAVFAVPFAITVRRENANVHNITSMVLHVLMAVCIAFAAAGTSVVTVLTETDVYVVADVSYSADKNLDTVDGYIKNLRKNLPRNSKLGIVCFGKDYELITKMGGSVKSVKESTVDKTETDIVSALEYAGTLFEDGVIKRIVLITDGRQSDLRDGNALKRSVESLAQTGVTVDAIYLDDNLKSDMHEIQVSGADYSGKVFLNIGGEKVIAYVQSNYTASNIRVSLYSDGVEKSYKMVSLSQGSTAVSFDLPTDVKGTFDYEIRVDGLADDEDYCTYNNKISFTQTVSDAVNVLLITGNAANTQYVNGIYGDKSTIDSYVVASAHTANVPVTIEELCAYDEIVLADVDITNIENNMMFIDSLDKAVSVFGKNLITLGDTAVQNRPEESLKQLQDMLPVRFGYGEEKLYTIVVDTSRSMATNYRLDIAKQAAHALVEFLGNDDMVCIVEFNGDVRTALPPTEAYRKQLISDTIDKLGVMQGTIVQIGLEQALNEMVQLTKFKEKQIMFISDGLSASLSTAQDDVTNVMSRIRANNIRVSTIDVGRGGDYNTSSEAKAAVSLLKNISEQQGRGKYFYAQTLEGLEEILYTDIAESVTRPVVNEVSRILQNRAKDDVLADFTEEENATVGGYINGNAKGSATTVLNAEYYNTDLNAYCQAPLYSYWSYGSGKVASYTGSNVKGWSDNWQNKTVFFRNMFSTCMPSQKTDYPFLMNLSSEGKFAKVEITPATQNSQATATAVITAPDGEQLTYNLISVNTAYAVEFETPLTGKYGVQVTYVYGGNEYTAETAFNHSYEAEYDMFADFDASELYKMVGGSGTVSEDGNLKIVNDERKVGTYIYSLVVPLLAASVVLFVIDIIIRKLKWNDIKNLFVRVKKK